MGKIELVITIALFNIFFLLFVVAVFVYIKRYRRKKYEYISEIQIQNEEHQKELLVTQLEIQRDTMQQIGRELHDNIGQNVTLVSLYTQQLLYENKAPQVNDKIDQIAHILNHTLQELRSLSKSLTSDKIVNHEITELIREEVDKTNTLKQCQVSFESSTEQLDLSFVQKNVFLRITQEFILNALKHADCKAIHIQLDLNNDNELILNIKDDGKGFDTAALLNDGIGLKNMKKRTEMIGGQFQLKSELGWGTQLIIKLKI